MTSYNEQAVEYALKRFQSRLDQNNQQQYSCTSWLRRVSFTDCPPALLKTVSSDALAAEGMVAKAIEKGWSPISVSGTEEFKSNVFHQAVRMGVEISNYSPTQKDIDLLRKANVPIPAWVPSNEISGPGAPVAALVAQPVAVAAPVDADASVDTARLSQSPVAAAPGEILVNFGAAPYKHQKDESNSFFVTTRDDLGKEKTVWGVDLERAIEAADCAAGDRITLNQLGKMPVQIKAPIIGADGKITGETEPKTVTRNAWEIAILVEAELKAAPKASRPSSPSMSM